MYSRLTLRSVPLPLRPLLAILGLDSEVAIMPFQFHIVALGKYDKLSGYFGTIKFFYPTNESDNQGLGE